jgi:hypothetical protein
MISSFAQQQQHKSFFPISLKAFHNSRIARRRIQFSQNPPLEMSSDGNNNGTAKK